MSEEAHTEDLRRELILDLSGTMSWTVGLAGQQPPRVVKLVDAIIAFLEEAESDEQVPPGLVQLANEIVNAMERAGEDARKQRDRLRAEQNGQREQPMGKDRGKAAKQRDQDAE